MRPNIGMLACVALVACQQRQEEAPVAENAAAPMTVSDKAPPKAKPERTPLAEPKGPIDPKSPEAAGQVLQRFGALIEQGRWKEAEALFGDAGAAAEATAPLRAYREAHLEIGDLGKPEGAAGSIYVSMPVTFYGKRGDGTAFRDAATVILRRINDVPGSTEAQRRWHIERIEAR